MKLLRLEQRSRDTGSHLIFVTSVIKPDLVVGFDDLFQPDRFCDSVTGVEQDGPHNGSWPLSWELLYKDPSGCEEKD